MIVDCHTHIWESVDQLGRGTGLWSSRHRNVGRATAPRAGFEQHWTAAGPVDQSFVLAFKSHYLDAEVPNDYVAQYVKQHPEGLIGFACVDPTRPNEAIEELQYAHEKLGMQGLTLGPAAQDFHPASSAAMRVYTEACRLGMPIIFHHALHASPTSKMEFGRPYLLDEVAREFPDLKIVISHLGYPWTEETVAMLGKHGNVFADISGLLHHQWQSYNALLSAFQAGVMEALLFGSNFPYSTAAACIESLYSINTFCHGTNLPTIPREQLRRIVERDAVQLLGIGEEDAPAPPPAETTLIQTED